jgi:hypothetical protein
MQERRVFAKTAKLIAVAILEPLFYFAVTFSITFSGPGKLHFFAAPPTKTSWQTQNSGRFVHKANGVPANKQVKPAARVS